MPSALHRAAMWRLTSPSAKHAQLPSDPTIPAQLQKALLRAGDLMGGFCLNLASACDIQRHFYPLLAVPCAFRPCLVHAE
jgi:hypothetical protein